VGIDQGAKVAQSLQISKLMTPSSRGQWQKQAQSDKSHNADFLPIKDVLTFINGGTKS